MIVFRLSLEKYKGDLSGKGAEIAGGRWNSKGIPMLYTSDSIALCTLEITVHSSSGNIPKNYFISTIVIPDDLKIHEINISELSEDWKKFPYSRLTKSIGDNFIKEKLYPVLQVPSAVV